MKTYHGQTTTSQTDTEIKMGVGEGVYHFRTVGLHTDSTVANLASIYLNWEDSDGVAHADVLWSGLIHAHQDVCIIDRWVVGPGTLYLVVLKEDGTSSTGFVVYEKYTQEEYARRRLSM